ncbi:MAG: ATP-binding protein, partial [Chthoniobacteraceae bacterium]
DAVALEQVLVNLAVNARDAMPEGGNLSISVEEMTISNAKGHKARNGHFLCLTVSDDGCGMSREVMTHLFEPFFTTKKIGAGTGLGLASAYGIVQQHGGWIAADSTVGRGSTFKIHLPVNSTEQPQPEETESAENSLETKGDGSFFAGKRVLVVEDNIGVKLTFRALLKRDGWEVIEAGNMAEAEKIWMQKGADIDLVITDLVMPGKGTGRDFAVRILADHDHIPIICTTGYSPDVAGVLDLDPERVGFLAKPFTPAELRQLIRRLLHCPVGAAS